jgi:hypothetical protein
MTAAGGSNSNSEGTIQYNTIQVGGLKPLPAQQEQSVAQHQIGSRSSSCTGSLMAVGSSKGSYKSRTTTMMQLDGNAFTHTALLLPFFRLLT